MSLLPSQHEKRSMTTIKRLTTLQNNIIKYMMELSKDELYQDVTVIGQNGLLKSNTFLLATIFPVFKTLFTSSAQNDEPIVISD